MTGLKARLARLEARTPAVADDLAQDAAAFLSRMDALSARVAAAGNFADHPLASPAERYCRALLRGDEATAEAIIREAIAGLP